MAKVRYGRLPKAVRSALRRELFGMLRRLGGSQEVAAFLDDLLTESEIVMLARRIQIAKRRIAGQSFAKIASGLHVGFDTIRDVDRWLQTNRKAAVACLP